MHYIRTCSEVISEGANVWLGQCGSQTVIRSAWYIVGYEGYIISVWHQVVYITIKKYGYAKYSKYCKHWQILYGC